MNGTVGTCALHSSLPHIVIVRHSDSLTAPANYHFPSFESVLCPVKHLRRLTSPSLVKT